MSDVEIKTVEISGKAFVLKLIPTMSALSIVQRLEREGFTPEVIFDVVSKGAMIGSVNITQKKFDEVFAGKIKELMELFAEVLKYNNLVPDADEGNESGSEE